nr:putative serine protease 47 [Camelus dromedarius]
MRGTPGRASPLWSSRGGAGMETWTSEPAQSSGSWARAWFSWTSYPRRNAAWGLGCHFLSPLLPSLVRNPSPSFPLWSSRGGAGMQAWTSEPAQSSGSWARARCSWTSYPRRNAAWGLGRHFLSPLLPSLVRKSQFLENYRVLLGNTQLYQHTRHTQKIPVSQIIVYPDFDKFHPFGNDIAMLQLLFPVNFTSYIIPACLPAPCMQLPSNSSCWITGWGMGEGDSRGPLVCDLTNAWVLVGLASWGLDCQHPIYRSIFTNVSYFIDWMDEIQRLTPLPDAMSVPPQTQFPHQPLQAAGSPGPGTGFVPPQPWPLLLFLLQAPRQALW